MKGCLILLGIFIGVVVSGPPALRKNTLFASNSIWRSKLPDDAPISVHSEIYVTDFLRQCNYSGSHRPVGDVWFGPSLPIYIPAPNQTTSVVQIKGDPDLVAYSSVVPIPPVVKAEICCDHEIIFYDNVTDSYWEYWLFNQNGTTYSASWGGYMANQSTNPGYFTSPHDSWGAAATSMAIAGGTVALADAISYYIPYTIRLTLQDHARGIFVPPAQRTDGNGNGPIPEGTRFRLPASFNTSTIVDPFARALATAIRDYGMITTDTTSGMPVLTAEDTRQYVDYNDTDLWAEYIWGSAGPLSITRQIPWNLLQVVDPVWQPYNSLSPWYQEGDITGPSSYVIKASQTVFNDSLVEGWADDSWNSPVSFVPMMGGGVCIQVVYSQNAGAFYLHSANGNIDTTNYNALQLTVQGAAESADLLEQQCLSILQLVSGSGPLDGAVRFGTLFTEGIPETWTTVTIPFADMGWTPETTIQGFWLQGQMEISGQTTLYILDISLVNQVPVYATPNNIKPVQIN